MSKLFEHLKHYANIRQYRTLNIFVNVMIFEDIFIFISEALKNDNVLYMNCCNEESYFSHK